MRLHLFWLFLVVLFAALAAGAKPKTHYHRYQLSDYKPQHNPRTQMDYKRHKPRTQDANETANPEPTPRESSQEPEVVLNKSRKKLRIHELIVRIYQDHQYLCVGTLIAEELVITTATCFDETSSDVVILKTYTNEVLVGEKQNINDTYLHDEDPLLITIALQSRPREPRFNGDIVKLCDVELLDQYQTVEVPLWLRRKHSVHTRTSWTMPMQECRNRMKDPQGAIARDRMLCIRNQRYTATCQNAIGNPLIYNNMLCGVNVAGHNCPTYTGVNLYTNVYDEHDFGLKGLDLLKRLNIEESIL